MARSFLIISALVWLPYGIYCFIDPGQLADGAGVVAQSATGVTELRAMYGGLQAAIGVLLLLGAFAGALRRPALLSIAFLTTGLGSARFLGVLLAGGVSGYTVFGLLFEIGSAACAWWLLRQPAAER